MDQKLIEQAKGAKSAKELSELAKANGVVLSEQEAATYFAKLNKQGELADDELDNVAGGGCVHRADEKKEHFFTGDTCGIVDRDSGTFYRCPGCGGLQFVFKGGEWTGKNPTSYTCKCKQCREPATVDASVYRLTKM